MSVIRAILFYSKHDKKSLRLKQVSDNISIDIDTVSVDSVDIRERLLEDEKYGIHEVPAVLILYSTGQHKTYVGQAVDQWFDQLLQNIQQLSVQEQEETESYKVIDDSEYDPMDTVQRSVPKELKRRPAPPTESRNLPAPGRQKRPIEDPLPMGNTPLTDISDEPEYITGSGGIPLPGGEATTVMAGIKEPDQPLISFDDPHIQQGRKEVKTTGLSAKDIAEQMARQKEAHDEAMDSHRPFI